eukprot:669365-Prorocentrum_lima.AAC.1
MTSSLVGSEMCIRDRPKDARRGPGDGGGRWLGQAVRSSHRQDGHSEEPVSYTHLTLPTICSV